MTDHHPHDDLPGLLFGELDRAEVMAVSDHLADCDDCRRELAMLAATSASLRATARQATPAAEAGPAAEVDPAGEVGPAAGAGSAADAGSAAAAAVDSREHPVSPPATLPLRGATPRAGSLDATPGAGSSGAEPGAGSLGAEPAAGSLGAEPGAGSLGAEPGAGSSGAELGAGSLGAAPGAGSLDAASEGRARAGWRRPLVGLAAALVLAVVAAAVLWVGGLWRPDRADRTVPLAGVGAVAASGRASMDGHGADRRMTVSADGLPAPGPGRYYEVWLLDPDAGTVFPVGVLPADGEARFTLPASVVGRYQAIDVSLEADDGDPTHSRRSLLRGRYA